MVHRRRKNWTIICNNVVIQINDNVVVLMLVMPCDVQTFNRCDYNL